MHKLHKVQLAKQKSSLRQGRAYLNRLARRTWWSHRPRVAKRSPKTRISGVSLEAEMKAYSEMCFATMGAYLQGSLKIPNVPASAAA